VKHTYTLIFLLLASFSMQGQQLEGIFESIAKSDVEAVGSLMNNNLELCINQNQDNYPKAEAIVLLKKFLAENKPKSCKMLHNGASKGKDSIYGIGSLVADSGKYRVYVYAKKGDGKVQEIRIEKED
jgi:hypothetical protein